MTNNEFLRSECYLSVGVSKPLPVRAPSRFWKVLTAMLASLALR